MKKVNSPSKDSSRRNILVTSLISSLIAVFCCFTCLIGLTWAWFTANASVSTGKLSSATYKVNYLVTDGENEVLPVEGKYTLDPSKTYTVTITAEGTASTGIATFSLDGEEEYTSIQLPPPETISFLISGYTGMDSGSSWGLSELTERVVENDEIFKDVKLEYYAFGTDPSVVPDKNVTTPVVLAEADEKANQTITIPDETALPQYDGYMFIGWALEDGTLVDADSTFYQNTKLYAKYDVAAVKLIPASDTSTVMIERDGKVETYNTGMTTLPFGVTAENITLPVPEYTEATDFGSYYVYGLTEGITATVDEDGVLTGGTLAGYIAVQGDGYCKVVKSDADAYGTGAVIEVYDRKGTDTKTDDVLVEKFYIIIFGDINGDARVTSTDTSLYNAEVRNHIWSEGSNVVSYKLKAADLNTDGKLTSTDTSVVKAVIKGSGSIDQTVGAYKKN